LDFIVHPLSQFIFDFPSFGLPLFGVRESDHFKASGSFASTGMDETKELEGLRFFPFFPTLA
jgi:hypothetical protein